LIGSIDFLVPCADWYAARLRAERPPRSLLLDEVGRSDVPPEKCHLTSVTHDVSGMDAVRGVDQLTNVDGVPKGIRDKVALRFAGVAA
jgi:hypothetical protein